jgi:predicted histone-like DNA-binding protein
MAIKYVLVQKGNLRNSDEPKKWYVQVKSDGDINLKKLGKETVQICSGRYADVLMVLVAFSQTLSMDLGANKIVHFGDSGSFRIGINSKGVKKIEKFRSSMIDSTKVIFTLDKDLKTMLNNLEFEKIC